MARARLTGRPVGEWLGRGALLLALLAAGYFIVTRSLAAAVRANDLDLSLRLAPTQERSVALQAQKLSNTDASPGQRRRADDLARLALAHDPTLIPALISLGVNAQLRGDTGLARRLFAYSQKLSRRDLPTRMWVIEDAVGRGDVAGALKNYDIALRTSRLAPGVLLPILASAIADEQVRAALAPLMARSPWSDEFIQYIGFQGPQLEASADLMIALGRRQAPVSGEARAVLIRRLVEAELPEAAWKLYAAFNPGADRGRSRDPDFRSTSTAPSLFDWLPLEVEGVKATTGTGSMAFSLPPSVGGAILQQTQLLPPGVYTFAGQSLGIEQPRAARPYWQVQCRDGRPLAKIEVPGPNSVDGGFAGRFTVPGGCTVQSVQLIVRPTDAIAGMTGELTRARIVPVR